MIIFVTLNAAIDKTYFFENFSVGTTNRTRQQHIEPGGKGNNGAKVAHALGYQKVLATGFLGGTNGEMIRKLLDERNISHHFIEIKGESRTCLTILDESLQIETEILEEGPIVSSHEWQELCEFLQLQIKEDTLVVLSGSVPKGLSDRAYNELIQIVHTSGGKTILDSSGEAFRKGLEMKPFAVKPNENELKQWLKKDEISLEDAIQAGKLLNSQGIAMVCISLGEMGAILVSKGKVYRASNPKIDVMNTIGCGDAMVAGFAVGLAENMELEQIFALASACGAANAMQRFAGMISIDDVEQLKKRIQISQL